MPTEAEPSVESLSEEVQPEALPTLPAVIYLCVLIAILLMGLQSLFAQRHPKQGTLLDGEKSKPLPIRYLVGIGCGMLVGFFAVVYFGIQGASVLDQVLEATKPRW